MGQQAVIHASQERSSTETASPFRQACLLSAFRQELYIGLTAQRSVQYPIPHDQVDMSVNDDWSWSKLAVTDCATVVNYVHGDNRTPERTAELSGVIRKWQENTLQSFRPLGDKDTLEGQATAFPYCPMLAPCHGR